MTKQVYSVITNKSAARDFIAWEFGVGCEDIINQAGRLKLASGAAFLAKLEEAADDNPVDLLPLWMTTLKGRATKAQADALAQRINVVAGYFAGLRGDKEPRLGGAATTSKIMQ